MSRNYQILRRDKQYFNEKQNSNSISRGIFHKRKLFKGVRNLQQGHLRFKTL